MLVTEFDRQTSNLVQMGYPRVAGVTTEEFLKLLEPLEARVGGLGVPDTDGEEGRLPFVIVVKSDLVTTEKAMPLVDRNGKHGVINLYPREPTSFKPIEDVRIPAGMVYLVVDIDRGKETINVAPEAAMKTIKGEQRSPLTIDEGIAIITHYPGFLKKNNCFSLLASRCGDRRVPAIWISESRPKLGWCWDGNPHTWLGSASCARRVES